MKRFTRILLDVLPLILTFVGSGYALKNGHLWFSVPVDGSFHFDIITVNSVFAGFLYTNYSLLIGLFDNAIIKKIQGTGIIKKRNQHIMRGIIYATISIVSGLYLVFIPQGTSCFSKAIWYLFQDAEIVFMGFLIVYFLLSLCEMGALVKSVYQSGQVKTEAEIKELKEQIKKSATKEK